jgi:hypothetical protein
MGWRCPVSQQHDGNLDALAVQLDQQVDAANLRPVTMEDDDIGIARGIWCARQQGEFPDRKALLGQLVGQESAIDRAVPMRRTRIASGSPTEASSTGAPASKVITSSKTVVI